MCDRGVWQLKSVLLRYSETGNSSGGVRFFLRTLLPRWQERNPQVEVLKQHAQFEPPQATFFYRSGISNYAPLSNLAPRQIEELLQLHRDSHSPNAFLKHGGPKTWTQRRSIQGLWKPSLPSQLLALKWFRRKRPPLRLPKYSPESLALSLQAVRGEGRWGSERQFLKCFDQLALRLALHAPFVATSRKASAIPTVTASEAESQASLNSFSES